MPLNFIQLFYLKGVLKMEGTNRLMCTLGFGIVWGPLLAWFLMLLVIFSGTLKICFIDSKTF